jgi:hypothetical protein
MTASTARTQTYLVISPHSAEQCLKALDHLADTHQLAKWEFGCKHGDHTGYARLQGSSPEEVLSMVPEDERASARAIALETFTAEQIRAAHQK